MASQGAALQNHNTELVKCTCALVLRPTDVIWKGTRSQRGCVFVLEAIEATPGWRVVFWRRLPVATHNKPSRERSYTQSHQQADHQMCANLSAARHVWLTV
jgi:hypothetical protein